MQKIRAQSKLHRSLCTVFLTFAGPLIIVTVAQAGTKKITAEKSKSAAKQTAQAQTPPTQPAPTVEKIVLDDFEGKFDWTEGNMVNGKTDYNVTSEAGGKFLRAKFIPGTEGKVIYKKITWDTEKYPILSWKWRANKFPRGARLMEEGKGDAVAQVYVSWRVNGRAWGLKYFWSETDPVGTNFHYGKWNPLGRYFADVIRMGGATGEWVTERRNIKEDYTKAYGEPPPTDGARGIGLLTDGDQTRTEPEADYDQFEALSR